MSKAARTRTPITTPILQIAVGDVFSRLTAVRDLGRRKRKRVWLFQCECGEPVEAQSALVRRGYTKSCGCFRREWARDRQLKHGHHRSPTYCCWQAMIERCRNPNNRAFKHYGGRGISVCEKWLTFEGFLADMGERPANLSIDRIEVNGNYEPGNCRWATDREQINNRRNTIRVHVDGVELPLTEACERLGLIYATVYSRIRSGMHPLAALGLTVAPVGQTA